jgi:hypothetical protein
MLVQPQQAATVCELDLVQHDVGSWKRAQTWIRTNGRRTAHEPLNLTLDCEHAHVSGHFGVEQLSVHSRAFPTLMPADHIKQR